MMCIRELSRHAHSLEEKLASYSAHKLGQKAMNTACVIGRKMGNTLHKI